MGSPSLTLYLVRSNGAFMSKRILILSTVHPLGHPRHTMKLGRGLAESGFEVELWGRGTPPAGLPDKLRVHRLPVRGKWARMLDLPAALLRGLTGGHDLVIVDPPETVPLGLLLHLFGKKVIWDVEEDSASAIEHSDWLPQTLRRPIAAVFRGVEQLAARSFPAVSLAEDGYLPRFQKANRAEVIHNYPPRPNPDEDLSRGTVAEERWKLDGPRLIYIGMVTEHRGLAEAIRAVGLLEEELPGIHLDVVGTIPQPAYHNQLKRLRAGLKKPERVTLHGGVPFDELNRFLGQAQVGILPLWPQPNHRVSLQTKLFEYALAGLPTVVGDLPSGVLSLTKADRVSRQRRRAQKPGQAPSRPYGGGGRRN